MDFTSREISAVFKLILVLIFGGMSFIFWLANRIEDSRRAEQLKELDEQEARNPIPDKELTPLEKLQRDFSKLFTLTDSPLQHRKLLADVLNRLFALGDVSIACPFESQPDETGKPTDQIDGVIKLDKKLYLVDMRWEDHAVGVDDIKSHAELLRSDEPDSPTRGIFISFSGYTDQALEAVKKTNAAGNMLILCTIADFTHVLEGEGHLDAFLRTRINIAAVDKNPYASYV